MEETADGEVEGVLGRRARRKKSVRVETGEEGLSIVFRLATQTGPECHSGHVT